MLIDGYLKNTVLDEGSFPAWSPDGGRIAYLQCCPNHQETLLISNVDGTNKEIINDQDDIRLVRWMPNGILETFPFFHGVIYMYENGEIIERRPSNPYRLMRGWLNDEFIDKYENFITQISAGRFLLHDIDIWIIPSPSGDSELLQIEHYDSNNDFFDLWLISNDILTPLLEQQEASLFPSWSSDENKIVYVKKDRWSYRSEEPVDELRILNLINGDDIFLVKGSQTRNPRFIDQNSKIVYHNDGDWYNSDGETWVINPDGTGNKQIYQTGVWTDWTPF